VTKGNTQPANDAAIPPIQMTILTDVTGHTKCTRKRDIAYQWAQIFLAPTYSLQMDTCKL